MKPQTKNKILLTTGIVLSVLVLSIAPIGGVAGAIVGGIFNGRASDESSLKSNVECFTYKTRADFASLSTRTDVTIESSGNKLAGHLYQNDSPKGLVVTAHGLSSLSDGVDANYQAYFVSQGWDVLALDLTASGYSEGTAHYLDQSAIDVSNAVKWAASYEATKDLPVCLVGHSWGAYGVLASYAYESSPKAVCSFASFIQPDLEMIDTSVSKMGSFLKATKWCMDMGLYAKRGEAGFLNAATALENNKTAKVILVQGEDDKTVTSYSSSYHRSAKFGNERTTPILLENRGHSDLFYSDAAVSYKKEVVDPKLSALGTWKDLSLEQKEAFSASIDKEKTSELNADLFARIESIFEAAVTK